MPHYAKCDVISRQNNIYEISHQQNVAAQKVKKNLYYSFNYSFTSYNNNFRVIGTLSSIIKLQ